MFEKAIYKVNLKENSLLGSEVVRLKAHDPDLGNGGIVKYHIRSVSSFISFLYIL